MEIQTSTSTLSELIKNLSIHSKEIAEELEALVILSKLLGHTLTIRKSGLSIRIDESNSLQLFFHMTPTLTELILTIFGKELVQKITLNRFRIAVNLQLTKTTHEDIIQTIKSLTNII